MASPHANPRDIDFGGPATYRIVVQGSLGSGWSSRIGDLNATTLDRGERSAHTVLEGPIRDQAELSGLLDTLHGLHLPILRVEKLDEDDDT